MFTMYLRRFNIIVLGLYMSIAYVRSPSFEFTPTTRIESMPLTQAGSVHKTMMLLQASLSTIERQGYFWQIPKKGFPRQRL